MKILKGVSSFNSDNMQECWGVLFAKTLCSPTIQEKELNPPPPPWVTLQSMNSWEGSREGGREEEDKEWEVRNKNGGYTDICM